MPEQVPVTNSAQSLIIHPEYTCISATLVYIQTVVLMSVPTNMILECAVAL